MTPGASAQASSRPLDPEHTVYLDVDHGDGGVPGRINSGLGRGRVVIELNRNFAPRHVEQFKRLVRRSFYDGQTFYRVIEGFVAQAGDGSDLEGVFPNPTIQAEFERPWRSELSWTPVQHDDPFAPLTGFVEGFAVGRNPATESSWLLHCPGVVAMARNENPDTASTDFYIVIGQAPRYLDRNLTIFGRVVFGMDVVQRVRRGAPHNDGALPDLEARSKIVRARVAADLPAAERLEIRLADTAHPSFVQMLEQRRDRNASFFHNKPPAVLDICQIPVRGREVAAPHPRN